MIHSDLIATIGKTALVELRTHRIVAQRLGVAARDPKGVLIIGAHR